MPRGRVRKRGIMKFKAFTLAEMLITIGIIGFVSAMTIPSLISNVNDTRFRTQFLKTYAVIQQAVKRMEADDIAIDPKLYDRMGNPFYRTFLSYLTNATDCGDCCAFAKNPMPTGCFDYNKNSYLTFRGNGTLLKNFFDDGQILMPDGSLVMVEQPGGSGEERIYVFVDVNGTKPPNRLGHDLFVLQFTDNGLLPMGQNGTDYAEESGTTNKYCDKHSGIANNGMSCSSILFRRPDYFKWIKRVTD